MSYRNLQSKISNLQSKIPTFAPQTALSLVRNNERKVRTPKRSIAANSRRPAKGGLGPVQQKECTDHAVVKPGKLYAVKFQVYRLLRVSRPLSKGRKMEYTSNCVPR